MITSRRFDAEEVARIAKILGKITLAHLHETPDYYDRLARMEAESEGDHAPA